MQQAGKKRRLHGSRGKMSLRENTFHGGCHAIVYSFYPFRTRKSTYPAGAGKGTSPNRERTGTQRFYSLPRNEEKRKKGWLIQCLVGHFALSWTPCGFARRSLALISRSVNFRLASSRLGVRSAPFPRHPHNPLQVGPWRRDSFVLTERVFIIKKPAICSI